MDIIDIIAKKRDGKELETDEINYFINNYTSGRIEDYQASALVMAIYINGMNYREIKDMTMAMANSGDILDLSELGRNVVDKHSTGGVGDKVTIILAPLIASLGIPVAKMSGRGLGFTGGTADKIESIPGYNTEISEKEFINNVKNIGISLITQTLNLAPADKKIYALRDTIACTESIPLIASSIMSKKIASGANKIVLDVTCGYGAFMKDIKSAKELSDTMIKIGTLAERETVCIITNMNEPLGFAVGNSLEIIEAIEFLNGKMPEDLKEVVLELGAYMVKLAGKGENIETNKEILLENIRNGKAYNKFIELVQNQGGNIDYIKDVKKFEKAKVEKEVASISEGYIQEINAEEVGKIACNLGAGRKTKKDKIELNVGLILNKKTGDYVKIGDKLVTIYASDEEKAKQAEEELIKIFKIGEKKVTEKTIIDIIN
ncbi:MAG TPA: thymidine phosphorylase [Clostridiaceae bacterium]|jgi:pyrimidine-nucleoside phosphorylase|nr:thymidine phosphorylase [Clostridium sp.]MEE0127952.1 thymidine phosphorylase [Clostridia bacterium]HJJ12193.1 thymidine phosphorylase [Clostridiaceae bacterium]